MECVVDVPEKRDGEGMRFVWDPGYEIAIAVTGSEISIRANRAGLVSLARHLLTLAQESARVGSHVHLTAGQEIDSEFDLILELSEE
jgi:hypothetical protein